MPKAILPEMEASAGGAPPIWATGEAVQYVEAICFCFGAISPMKSSKKIKIRSSKLWVLSKDWRSLQTLNTELKEEEESNDDSWKDALRLL